MNQQLLNNILVENTQNIDIVNKVIADGANNYSRALLEASRKGHQESIDVLKVLVTPNEGLLMASCSNNIDLVNHFLASATNKDECCFEAATRNYNDVYEILKTHSTPDNGMKCATYRANVVDITTFKDAGATNFNECLLIACRLNSLECANLLLGFGANNQEECLQLIYSDSNKDNIKKVLLGI